MVMDRSDRLGPKDWVAAALSVLAEGGIGAVRVDRLAKTLGVTRGSFYWHFGNRRMLLDALLETWRAQQTDDVIAHAEALGQPPAETLRAVLRLCFEDDGRLESAFRSWAAGDPAAARVVAAADRRRIGYLASLLQGIGHAESSARARARIAYRVWLGDHALVERSNGEDTDADIDQLYAMLVK